jgi:hypothetical protein
MPVGRNEHGLSLGVVRLRGRYGVPMPGQRSWGAPVVPVLLTALLLAPAACASNAAEKAKPKAQSATQCRSQWHDVADSVLGLDQETNPSSLASRWNSVVATVQYYENSATAKNCQQNIEAQVRAITALRQLNEKLRPYDMSYQVQQVGPSIDLYLHDPLPSPARNQNGKLVRPPGKIAVQSAQQTLTRYAAAADAELQPGWGQLASVDINDSTALAKALSDLDQLAQDSQSWQACEQALQVIVAAIRAQEGLIGAPAEQSTQSPSATPTP